MKYIVLDMGNVCCRWDPRYIASQLTEDKDEQDFLVQSLFGSFQWQQLDKGDISINQAIQQLTKQYPQYESLIEYTFNHWYDFFDVIDEMEQFIIEYKNDYDFYLLSNCSVQFDNYYQSKSIFKYFKDYYLSAKHHMVKPDKAIFLDFLNYYHLEGRECLFVDDIEENVQGAKAAGMKGYCFDGDVNKLKKYMNVLKNENK